MTERGGFHSGVIGVVGRPNVGKSTLLNRLVGETVSITSARPQTTRHVIRGILTTARCQYVFVDTPGYQTRRSSTLNRLMNRRVVASLGSVDLVFLVMEAMVFRAEDRRVRALLPQDKPVILVVNKIDRVRPRTNLLPYLETVAAAGGFAEVVPVSAAHGENLAELLRVTEEHLPSGAPLYPPDEITDRPERFLAAEFLREKLFRRLGDELPYGLTVEIERFEDARGVRRIAAAVIVDKASHRPIVIGRHGALLKVAATQARLDMERVFGAKVFLDVWVKVRSGWADDELALRNLGYD